MERCRSGKHRRVVGPQHYSSFTVCRARPACNGVGWGHAGGRRCIYHPRTLRRRSRGQAHWHIMASVHCDLGGVGERPFTPVDERAPFMPARATKRVTGYAHIPARHRRAPTPLPPRSAGRCSQKTHDGLSASGADNPAAAHTASGPTSTTSTSICPLSTAIVSSRLVSSRLNPSLRLARLERPLASNPLSLVLVQGLVHLLVLATLNRYYPFFPTPSPPRAAVNSSRDDYVAVVNRTQHFEP
jgi:hypothetical protein